MASKYIIIISNQHSIARAFLFLVCALIAISFLLWASGLSIFVLISNLVVALVLLVDFILHDGVRQ